VVVNKRAVTLCGGQQAGSKKSIPLYQLQVCAYKSICLFVSRKGGLIIQEGGLLIQGWCLIWGGMNPMASSRGNLSTAEDATAALNSRALVGSKDHAAMQEKRQTRNT